MVGCGVFVFVFVFVFVGFSSLQSLISDPEPFDEHQLKFKGERGRGTVPGTVGIRIDDVRAALLRLFGYACILFCDGWLSSQDRPFH
jgi:hypothetical protein